jgi:TPR repeat protein
MHPDIAKANQLFSSESYSEALSLIQPLVIAGDPDALMFLGMLYWGGFGVPPDGSKAAELLTRAMDAGVGLAAHNLGTLFATGMPGVTVDFERSRACYRRAKALGYRATPDAFCE